MTNHVNIFTDSVLSVKRKKLFSSCWQNDTICRTDLNTTLSSSRRNLLSWIKMGNLLSITSSCEVTGSLSKSDAADTAAMCFTVLNRKVIVPAPSAGSCWCCRSSLLTLAHLAQTSATWKVMLNLHLICLSPLYPIKLTVLLPATLK